MAELGALDLVAREVLSGLVHRPKRLPAKLFYDAEGSRLFERITTLPEYYLTRAEAEILELHGAAIAASLGAPVVMIEPGCGSSTKAAAILRHCPGATHVGVDIAPEALRAGADALARAVPGLKVRAVDADYSAPGWVAPELPPGSRVAFFPGSTIGNFDPPEARAFLARLGAAVGPGGAVVVGADVWKDPATLRAAYDDAQGVTAAFNRNALAHLRRRYGIPFVPERFRHHIVVDEARHVVQMHLASIGAQEVRLFGEVARFEDGETIHTESCYKWSPPEFRGLARGAGLAPVATYTDAEGRFAVHVLRA